jgi:hypothetical protein
MLKRFAVAVAALLVAFGPAGAAPQDDPFNLNLTFKLPSFKARTPLLVFNGTANVPDGTILKLNLARMTEQVARQEIQPMPMGAGSGSAMVDGKKFVYETKIEGPGKYNVTISLVDDLQDRPIALELKKKVGARRQWNFEYLVWGDDLISTVSSKLPDMASLVQECREIVTKFEKACATKAEWEVNLKPLSAEGNKFQAKLDYHELKAYFPASVNNLSYTVRNVVGNAPYYTYGTDGKFSGAKDYHADNNKVKDFQGVEFDWANLKRYIENTPAMAGREFCLWIVKDLRRTGGQMRPDIQNSLKTHKTAAGVDFFQDRLSKATITELDALEAQIRGSKAPAAPPGDGGAQKQ